MAHPSNSIPPRVGFPQAFGTQPYQPVSQFAQFQNQAAPGSITPATSLPNGFPQAQQPQIPVPGSTPIPNNAFPGPTLSNTNANNYAPPAPQPQSAFRPYAEPPIRTMQNGISNAPQQIPAKYPVVSQPQSMNAYSANAPNFQPMNGPKQPGSSFPVPTSSGSPSMVPPMPMRPTPVQPAFIPSQGYSQPQPPQPTPVQQLQKSFGQMNMGAPGQSQQQPQYPQPMQQQPQYPQPMQQQPQYPQPMQQQSQYPQAMQQQPQYPQPMQQHPQYPQPVQQMQPQQGGWGGRPAQHDVIDLLAERNVLQYGFDDIHYDLPQSLANSQARIDPSVFRSTLNHVPQSEEVLKKSRLPFGLTLQPFRDMKNLNIIQTSTIVRCRYCRTYINPFVQMPDSRRWKCNLCNRVNDLPDDFCWDHATKQFGDPTNRPEIRNATVEFIAPSEYMPVRKNIAGKNELRPPQPAVYVFIMDVSAAAIESGYLITLSEQLIINLETLPGDDRTQVAFVGVDSSMHFFQFNQNSKRPPRQLIIDDIDDCFLPEITGLLFPLKKNMEAVLDFLKQLPKIFEKPTGTGNCLGAALNSVHELIGEIGGRITVFQASLPTLGPGALQSREDPNQRASPEVQNLGPATDFYKRLALESTGHQIALDLFMMNSQYADIATLSEISKFSTGNVYHFPNFNYWNDSLQVKRFVKVLNRYLTRKIGFEAVLRIRCSRGLSLSAFYGNFFVRSTDLLALANVNPDSAIAVQVSLEEKLASTVAFQAALLYTSSKGDRRIRVHTMCLPTTMDLAQVYASFDLKASISLLAKLGVDRSMAGAPLSDSREAMVNAVVDTLGAFNRTIGQNKQALLGPRTGHLRLFPIYALAMLKHTSLCAGRSIRLDDRVASMLMLRFSPLEQILSEFYPQLYRINEIMQLPEDTWPQTLPLSFEHIHRDGVHIMEAGSSLFIYVSSGADAQFVHDVFGCSYNELDENSIREQPNPTSERVHAFLRHISALKFYLGPPVVIREDSPRRELFVRRLVDDRSESSHSYVEFIQHVKREINQ